MGILLEISHHAPIILSSNLDEFEVLPILFIANALASHNIVIHRMLFIEDENLETLEIVDPFAFVSQFVLPICHLHILDFASDHDLLL